jgi:hypothetical protein
LTVFAAKVLIALVSCCPKGKFPISPYSRSKQWNKVHFHKLQHNVANLLILPFTPRIQYVDNTFTNNEKSVILKGLEKIVKSNALPHNIQIVARLKLHLFFCFLLSRVN